MSTRTSFGRDLLALMPSRRTFAGVLNPGRRRGTHTLEILEARIAPAAALNATKVAVFAPNGDVNGDGKFQPGDTILYTVTITNSGDVDLTGVTFDDLIDPNTTLGPKVNVSPLALNDTFTAVANTLLEVGVTHGTSPAAQVAGSVVGNDVEFLGDTFTLSKLQATNFSGGTTASASAVSAQGGTVTMYGTGNTSHASGGFTYLPAAGFTGTDTFTYTLTDNGLDGDPGTADDLTSVGTVTITVGTQKVWYVDNSAAAGGDGRSTKPFNSITTANLNGAAGFGDFDGAGDILYFHTGSGSYTTSSGGAGLVLESNQTLWGQNEALIVGGFTLQVAGTDPTLVNASGHGVTLNSGNTLKGFTIGNVATNSFHITNASAASAGALGISNVNLSGTGGLLNIDSGGALSVVLDIATSTSATGHGINLQNTSGSLLASSGTLSGVAGTDLLVEGATATNTVSVNVVGLLINNSAGRAIDIGHHATGLITIGTINDTGGTGITVHDNISGTINFSGVNDVLGTGANNAVTLTANTGATVNFAGGGLQITTTSGTGFSATGGGTISVTGTGNTISSTSGTALNVANTTIGGSGLTFQSITAGTGAGSAGVGIILDTTGVAAGNGGLTVTGTGSAGSGGTIQHKTGTDSTTTGGIGIYLNNTKAVSLSRMQLNDFDNFAILGNNVAGFSLLDSVINGTNGTNENVDEGSVRFVNLTGVANITNTSIAGARENNFTVINTGAITLNRITFDNVTMGAMDNTVGDDAILLQANNGTMNVTVQNSFLTQARGDLFQFDLTGSAVGDLIFKNNDLINVYPNVVTGGGGMTISGGGSTGSTVALTYDIGGPTAADGNVFRGARGDALLIALQTGGGSFTGKIRNNIIGVAGTDQSGSREATGIEVRTVGSGNQTLLIDSNQIFQYGNFGILMQTGNQSLGNGTTGTYNATVTNNVISNPSTFAFIKNGIQLNGGTSSAAPSDAFQIGVDILNNTTGGSGQNGGVDIQLRQRFLTTVKLPGYGGANNDNAAVAAYIQARNTGAETVTASNSVSTGGGGFINGTVTTPPLMFAPSVDDVIITPTTVVVAEPVTPPTTGGTGGQTNPTVVVPPPVIVDDGILSQAELDSLVGAAIARWEATGLTPAQDALLHSVTFSVRDLPAWYLGEASVGHVTLDSNAAGNSWFIDATPDDDSEFADSHATATGGAAGRIDALTTVLHELGHQLGLNDSYVSSDSGNLMYGYIHQSERRLPTAHQADGAVPHLTAGELDFATVPVTIGSLPVGKSVRIDFTAQINSNDTASTITNQGTASSTQTGPVQSDDPNVAGSANPTVTQVDFPDVNLAIGATTSVAEDSGGNLVYTFTRQGPLTNSLTVNFTVAGGAVFTGGSPPSDYSQSGAASFSATAGTVTFGTGSSTATVTITPNADTATESNETVVLTLATGAGYDVATTGSTSGSGTITNDDTAVFVSGNPGSVAEDSGSTLVYTFKRAGVLSNALTVNLNLTGSATFTSDYSQAGAVTYNGTTATISFAPGSDTATLTLTPVADSTVEPDETVRMTVAPGTGYNAVVNSLTGTISNDDATVSVAITAPGTIAEDAAAGSFLTYTFTRNGFIANAVTVNFTASGSAIKDTDYGVNGASFIGLAGTVTFAPNSTTATVTVDPTADANGEPDETVIFTIDPGTGYSPEVTPNNAATGTILNDDTAVSVAVTGSPISEAATGGTHLTYTFTRTGDNSAPLTINFSAGGSASFANDYVLSGANTFSTTTGVGTITFAANSSTATVSVAPTNDTLVEGDEQAAIFVNTGPGYGVGASPAIGTITDNETATFSFVAATSSTPEGTTPHLVGVKLVTFSPEGTASLQNDFTVYVQDTTVPGVGVATGGGTDYTFNEQALLFSAGDTGSTKTVSATIVNDTVSEGNETFRLGLSKTSATNFAAVFALPPPAGGITVDSAPHTVTIVDNDGVDLILAQDDHDTVVAPGDIIKYVLTYQNGGFATATGVKITDMVPANTVFDAANSSKDSSGNSIWSGVVDGSVAGTTATYNIGSVAPGDAPVSVTFAVRVTPTVTAGAGTIDNSPTITDDGMNGTDLAPGSNTPDTDHNTLAAAPDLKLIQAADKLLIIRGQTLHTTYTYSNDGNQDTTGVSIVAHVPTGTAFNVGQSSGVWIPLGGGDFQLDVGAVPAHGSGSVIFAVDVNTTRVAGLHQVSTTAMVDDGSVNGPDPTPANNTAANTATPTRIYEGIYVVSQGIAVAGRFGTPTVHVYDPIDGHQLFQFDAYESRLRDSIRVAVADINGDGFDDIITTTGTGTGRLRVFNGLNGQWLHDDASYTGGFKNEIAVFNGRTERGAFVAAGDLTGDGRAEIVVGSALGGGKIRVFDGLTGSAKSFGTGPSGDTFYQPFTKTFRGGVRVAVGDVLGDGTADLVVGMGYYGSQVKVFDGDDLFRARLSTVPIPAAIDFKIGAKNFVGGVSVAVGDLDQDGKADLIIGRNTGRPTVVETFSGLLKDGLGQPRALGGAITPFDVNPARPAYALGVRVGVIDIDFDGIADIIAASGGNNRSTVNIYSGKDHVLLRSFTALPSTPNSALFTAGTAKMPVVSLNP